MILNLCHLNFFDVKFVSAKQKSVLASAVGTDFAVFNGRIIAFAVSAKGNRVDSFHQSLQLVRMSCFLIPQFQQSMRYSGMTVDARRFQALRCGRAQHRFRGNLFHIVLIKNTTPSSCMVYQNFPVSFPIDLRNSTYFFSYSFTSFGIFFDCCSFATLPANRANVFHFVLGNNHFEASANYLCEGVLRQIRILWCTRRSRDICWDRKPKRRSRDSGPFRF